MAPNAAAAHTNLAWVYGKKGDYQAAVIEYGLALKIDPKNVALHRSLGLALSDNGDVNGAIAELLTTTKLLPRDYESKMKLQALLQKRSE